MEWPHDLLRQICNDPETSKKTRRLIRRNLRPTEVEYKGCRMEVHPSDNYTEFLIWRKGRTQEERALRHIVRDLQDRPITVYDVGANAGIYSLRIAAVAAPGSVIHAFEPNPTMRSRLEKNIALNGFDSIQVHPFAISDSEGEMDLFVPVDRNLGEASLNAPAKGATPTRVQVRKLPEFLPAEPQTTVDFIKIDVEGLEDRVLAPVLADVPSARLPKSVFFEIEHSDVWSTDVQGMLSDAGYELDAQFGRNVLYRLK